MCGLHTRIIALLKCFGWLKKCFEYKHIIRDQKQNQEKQILQYKYVLELVKEALCSLKTKSKGVPELQFTERL